VKKWKSRRVPKYKSSRAKKSDYSVVALAGPPRGPEEAVSVACFSLLVIVIGSLFRVGLVLLGTPYIRGLAACRGIEIGSQPTSKSFFKNFQNLFPYKCSTITPPFENSCSTIELSNTLMERGFVFDNSFDNSEFSNDTLPFEGFFVLGLRFAR